eukprot:Rhum_TRINITY_DN4370_c0_g2::Rhum_TRINITY_DN4370_c0_g2_i1::g.14067::m.14067
MYASSPPHSTGGGIAYGVEAPLGLALPAAAPAAPIPAYFATHPPPPPCSPSLSYHSKREEARLLAAGVLGHGSSPPHRHTGPVLSPRAPALEDSPPTNPGSESAVSMQSVAAPPEAHVSAHVSAVSAATATAAPAAAAAPEAAARSAAPEPHAILAQQDAEISRLREDLAAERLAHSHTKRQLAHEQTAAERLKCEQVLQAKAAVDGERATHALRAEAEELRARLAAAEASTLQVAAREQEAHAIAREAQHQLDVAVAELEGLHCTPGFVSYLPRH